MQLLYSTICTYKTQKVVHLCLVEMLGGFFKKRHFKGSKDSFINFRITCDWILTILTPCRILTLNLLFNISIIKVKLQLLMITSSARNLLWNFIPLSKLEVYGKNFKTKHRKLIYYCMMLNRLVFSWKKTMWRWKYLKYTRERRNKAWKNNLNSTCTTDPLLGAFTCVFIFTTFYIGENWLRKLLTLDHTISYWILKQDLPDFQSLWYFYSFS